MQPSHKMVYINFFDWHDMWWLQPILQRVQQNEEKKKNILFRYIYAGTPTDTHTCTYKQTQSQFSIFKNTIFLLYNESFCSFSKKKKNRIVYMTSYLYRSQVSSDNLPLNTTIWSFLVLYELHNTGTFQQKLGYCSFLL